MNMVRTILYCCRSKFPSSPFSTSASIISSALYYSSLLGMHAQSSPAVTHFNSLFFRHKHIFEFFKDSFHLRLTNSSKFSEATLTFMSSCDDELPFLLVTTSKDQYL